MERSVAGRADRYRSRDNSGAALESAGRGRRAPTADARGRVYYGLKLARGYDAGISIEPHMVVVFHDAQSKATSEDAMRQNYFEYGRRVEKIVSEIRK